MLAARELEPLLSLLADDRKSFDVITTRFHKAYSRPHQFKAACTLCILLDDTASVGLLPLPKRLAGFFILHDLHKNESIKLNPFLEFLLQSAERADQRSGEDRRALVRCVRGHGALQGDARTC